MPVYKDKKRGTWYISTSYSPQKGMYKKLTKRGFKTRREAKEAEHILMSTLDRNSTGKFSLNVENVFNEYIKYAESKIKQVTLKQRKRHYEIYIKDKFGKRDMLSITPLEISDWQNDLLQTRKPSSVQIIHTNFNVLYSYIQKMYGISYNPLRQAGYVSTGNEKKKHNILDFDNFNKFIKEVDTPMYQVLFRVLYTTGMRCGEVLALNWNDIRNKTIQVNKTISAYGEITSPKTRNSHREIVLTQETYKVLMEWKKICEQEDEFVADGFIFGNKRFTRRNEVRNNLLKSIARANLPHMSPHDFRHSYVSILIDAGCDINAVAEIVGDTVETVSSVYTHMFSRKKQHVANYFDTLVEK